MNLDITKDRTNIILTKKALNDLCRIIYDDTKIRKFLCPCGLTSTTENDKEFTIISKYCDL